MDGMGGQRQHQPCEHQNPGQWEQRPGHFQQRVYTHTLQGT